MYYFSNSAANGIKGPPPFYLIHLRISFKYLHFLFL